MASGSGDAFWDEEDPSVAAQITDVLRLKRAWRNEKAAPEILDYETNLVQRAREQIQLQEENVEIMISEGKDDLTISLYQMDLDRTLFLLRSYLRIRLQKIHSKRRNRLEHKRLNDLVYVRYNQILHHRYQKRDSIDPISLKDIDDSNEWLTGQMDSLDLDEGGDGTAAPDLVFPGEDLNWAIVSEAAGVDEPKARTRAKGKAPASTSNVFQRRGRARLAQVDEEDVDEEEEEEEEEFVCDDDSDDYPEDETYDIDSE